MALQLDLQEANKKAAAGTARAGEEAAALRQQVEEQKRQLEEQRRRLEEASRGADGRSRQLEERERALADAETKLKRRKEKLDQQEAQMQKAMAAGGGGGGAGAAEAQARLAEVQAEVEKAREDARHSQEETERLLRLMQMSQEEQNQKEKTIRDLQEALKAAQAKLRSQQAANAQMREEVKQQQERERERERAGDGDGASDADGDVDEGGGDGNDGDGDGDGDGDRRERVAPGAVANVVALKDREIEELRASLTEAQRRAAALQEEVCALEVALQEQAALEELEELVAVVRLKDDRIAELEEALRESVRIVADRERALQHEEGRRRHVAEKVGKLEQRLASLQASHALRCSSCRPLLARAQDLEKRLARLLSERSAHLRDLAAMKQEALEAAISEKDAHLALLEVSGLRTARQAEQAERLKQDRRRLMERLKHETEQSVQLLQQYAPPESSSPAPSPPFGADDGDADAGAEEVREQLRGAATPPRSGRTTPRSAPSTPRHNGHPPPHAPPRGGQSEVEPDSLDPASSSETTPSM